jgi:hypothetical protein
MTASNCFYNGKCINISKNYEEVTKNGGSVNYDVTENAFKVFMETVAISSKATFNYRPTMDEIKSYIAKKNG